MVETVTQSVVQNPTLNEVKDGGSDGAIKFDVLTQRVLASLKPSTARSFPT